MGCFPSSLLLFPKERWGAAVGTVSHWSSWRLCLCFPQSRGYSCPVASGWAAAAANVRGAGGCWIPAALCAPLVKDEVGTWATDGTESLAREEFQNSDVESRLPGVGERADEWVVKGWPQRANQGKITSLLQRVRWDASACERKPQGFLSSGSTECSCK